MPTSNVAVAFVLAASVLGCHALGDSVNAASSATTSVKGLDGIYNVSALPMPPALPSAACIGQLSHVLESSPFSLAYAVDAWGKPSGILTGAVVALGEFDECVDIEVDKVTRFNYVLAKGQFIVGAVNLTLGAQLGFCVPDSCASLQDIRALLDLLGSLFGDGDGDDGDDIYSALAAETLGTAKFNQLHSMRRGIAASMRQTLRPSAVGLLASKHGASPIDALGIRLHVTESHPQTAADWSAGAVAITVIFSVLAAFIVLGTAYDHFAIQHEPVDSAVPSRATTSDLPQQADSGRSSAATLFPKPYSGAVFSEEGSGARQPLLPVAAVAPKNSSTHESFLVRLLLCFSLYRTGAVLFSTRRAPAMKSLAVLDVLRVISILWILTAHTCSEMIMHLPVNLTSILETMKQWQLTFMENSFIAVDTFFYLSSFIATYSMLASPQNLKKFSYLRYVVLRYLRLTPSYAAMLAMHIFLVPHLGRGPTWYTVYEKLENCSRYWWTHLIYINNFYPAKMDDECMPWTWYLATDYHWYLIAPLFVLMLASTKYRKAGVYLSIGVMVAQFAWTFAISFAKELPALASLTNDSLNLDNMMAEHSAWQTHFYMPFYNHFTVFLSGVLAAYACTRWRGWTLSQGQVWVCHAVAAATLLATVYLPYDFIHHGTRWSVAGNAAYNYFSRLSWAIGLTAVVMPSVLSGAESVRLLNAVWQWPVWRIMARLTYGVYLVHCILINIYFGNMMREAPFTAMYASLAVGGIAFWSYLAAALLFVGVEAPAASIVKLLLR